MMNTIFAIRALLLMALRYTIYLPFLAFYCFIVGPVVGGVLLVGGVSFLSFILGPKTAWKEFKKAYGELDQSHIVMRHS
ncbi:hypothetical protein [Photobacterium galatheae]|uniref:Uncharacterized protein n=1 Tax=Photobacterium galatheae TaxID=1654360 RepID=A0A066S1A4_9GAMM|nr:hypothetical protein [Photobacterium galatheae]KDM93433.1 hypothetical protein EA58_00785 [Photobacterium galatheae]MCM0147013.1 hypothetical protein [Photobacterium galatheae]